MDEVPLVPRDVRAVAPEPDPAVGPGLEFQLIEEGDRLEEGSDLMVSVAPLSQDLEPEVDLGKGFNFHLGAGPSISGQVFGSSPFRTDGPKRSPRGGLLNWILRTRIPPRSPGPGEGDRAGDGCPAEELANLEAEVRPFPRRGRAPGRPNRGSTLRPVSSGAPGPAPAPAKEAGQLAGLEPEAQELLHQLLLGARPVSVPRREEPARNRLP